ncbi:MAG TPA: histidine phosphatase family protein [Actinomycetes bacterium]
MDTVESVVVPERLLAVVRHAKAESGEEDADHDRALTARGATDAAAAGRWLVSRLQDRSQALGRVWVSSALRARSTWEAMRPELPAPADVVVDRALYDAGASDVLERLGEDLLAGGSTGVAVVVGHNPTMEHVVRILTGDLHGLRPSAVALIALDSDGAGSMIDRWSPH